MTYRKLALSIALCLPMPILLCVVGCSDWERTTFQTLSASKATIDGAQSAYEARTIPHTACVYGVINKAKAAQTLAVDAMMTYETAKASTGATAAQNVVTADLAQLAPIVASIGTLGSATCSAVSSVSDDMRNAPRVGEIHIGGLYAQGSIGGTK